MECRTDEECPPNLACNLLTLRCARRCKDNNDCYSDDNHRLCSAGLHVCVGCTQPAECAIYNDNNAQRCYLESCVECYDNRQCLSNSCIAGRCQKMH